MEREKGNGDSTWPAAHNEQSREERLLSDGNFSFHKRDYQAEKFSSFGLMPVKGFLPPFTRGMAEDLV